MTDHSEVPVCQLDSKGLLGLIEVFSHLRFTSGFHVLNDSSQDGEH